MRSTYANTDVMEMNKCYKDAIKVGNGHLSLSTVSLKIVINISTVYISYPIVMSSHLIKQSNKHGVEC